MNMILAGLTKRNLCIKSSFKRLTVDWALKHTEFSMKSSGGYCYMIMTSQVTWGSNCIIFQGVIILYYTFAINNSKLYIPALFHLLSYECGQYLQCLTKEFFPILQVAISIYFTHIYICIWKLMGEGWFVSRYK